MPKPTKFDYIPAITDFEYVQKEVAEAEPYTISILMHTFNKKHPPKNVPLIIRNVDGNFEHGKFNDNMEFYPGGSSIGWYTHWGLKSDLDPKEH